jgi:ribonuclease J
LQVTIHRGSKEIGGTCIQLSTENTTILLDAGLPLSESSAYLDLSIIKTDALLISHPHQDHYGLMDELPSSVPVYVGEVAKGLIEAPRPFLDKSLPHNSFRYIYPNKPIDIGDFQITPYLVDHSTPEAYAFLIESKQGVRVFYSGDLRAHGRKGFLFENMIKHPPQNIDVLFLEGTMMRRGLGEFRDEIAVEEAIVDVLKKQLNISFLITSSQNIDRIISASNACRRTGKVLVIDFYTAWILEQVKKVSSRVTAMEWDNVRVYAHYSHDQALQNNKDFFGDFRNRAYKHRITKEELMETPEAYLWLAKMSQFRIMEIYKQYGSINVIYSQWKGYLEDTSGKCYGAEQVASYKADPLVNYVYAHTSGHAPLEDLQRFADAINPRKLVPVHTEFPEDYSENFKNVEILDDFQSVDFLTKFKGGNMSHQFDYFRIAEELNAEKDASLRKKQWHFRGNCNSFSLISLSPKTPELGISGLKTKKQGENAFDWRLEKKIETEPQRSTPEKILQSWIIDSALSNGKKLPFGNDLTFLTSELAMTNVYVKSKGVKGKLVNDILAIDGNGTLWVVELKSDRNRKRLREQVSDFMQLVTNDQIFFQGLVSTLIAKECPISGEVKSMIVWPGTLRGDWGKTEEVCYYSDGNEFSFIS